MISPFFLYFFSHHLLLVTLLSFLPYVFCGLSISPESPEYQFHFDKKALTEILNTIDKARDIIGFNQSAFMNTYLHGYEAFELRHATDLVLYPQDYCFVCNAIEGQDPVIPFNQKVIEIDTDQLKLITSFVEAGYPYDWPLMREGNEQILTQFFALLRAHGYRVGVSRDKILESFWLEYDHYRCWPKNQNAAMCTPFIRPSPTTAIWGEELAPLQTSHYEPMPMTIRPRFRDYVEAVYRKQVNPNWNTRDGIGFYKQDPITGWDTRFLKTTTTASVLSFNNQDYPPPELMPATKTTDSSVIVSVVTATVTITVQAEFSRPPITFTDATTWVQFYRPKKTKAKDHPATPTSTKKSSTESLQITETLTQTNMATITEAPLSTSLPISSE